MRHASLTALFLCGCLPGLVGAAPEPAPGPLTAEETRQFLRELVRFVHDNHLKRAESSPQFGMVYEYLDMRKRGQYDQFVQGEALDTMHDGAWLAAALVNACNATEDAPSREFLTRRLLPFYLKMLNHGDELFSSRIVHVRPERAGTWGQNKEWLLQDREKGFVPYWWDDGGSVSLERRRDNNRLPAFPCFDQFMAAGRANPQYLLSGYSLGSSNHMAQDLGVMLEVAWLRLRNSEIASERVLAREVTEAAENLRQCRMRHHGHIPMCDAPAALARADGALMRFVPDQSVDALWQPENHYWKALYAYPPGQRMPFPGFADDQQYRYYYGLARHGGRIPQPLAFRLIYDALTEPMLYRAYCDDEAAPPGMNRFDLHPYYAVDGKPTDYRSDRKGPGGNPRPTGSRMGPQNMVCCGIALQLLREHPGVWDARRRRSPEGDLQVPLIDPVPGGTAKPTEPASVELGGIPLRIHGTRTGLRVLGEAKTAEITLTIFGRPDGTGDHAIVTVKQDGSCTARNDRGQPLRATAKANAEGAGFHFEIDLPYTLVKGQGRWANGVEFGRYTLRVGDEDRNFTLASPEDQVRDALTRELGVGLRTWRTIFDTLHYIPTGIGAGADWDRFSDSGGYAHLISAAAQWLLVLDRKTDWEKLHVPDVPVQR